MNTPDSSEYSEEEANLIEWLRPSDNLLKPEEDLEQSSGVVGLVTREGETPHLLHEENMMCWCRPTLIEERNYYVVVHHNKGDAD